MVAKSGVLFSQSLPGTISQIIQAVEARDLEGIVAKRLDSKYHPNRHSEDWLKLPLKPSQHFVVGAGVTGGGSSQFFRKRRRKNMTH